MIIGQTIVGWRVSVAPDRLIGDNRERVDTLDGATPGRRIEQARLMREIVYIVGFLLSREEHGWLIPGDDAHPYVQ